MDAKTWLRRGRYLSLELEKLERLREETYTRLTKVTQDISGEATSGTKDPHKFDQLAAYNEEIDRRLNELSRVWLEILLAIERLEDARYRIVLIEYYINRKEWRQVAAEMNYEERQVHRLHGAALQAIQPVIERSGIIKK